MKVLDGVLEDDRLTWRDLLARPGRRLGRRSALAEGESDAGRSDADAQRAPAARPRSEGDAESGTDVPAVLHERWLQVVGVGVAVAGGPARCADPRLRLEDFVGANVWIGFDSALKDDIATVAIITLRDGILYMFKKSFLPGDWSQRYAKLIPGVSAVGDGRVARSRPTAPLSISPRLRDYIVGCMNVRVQGVVIEQFAAGNLPIRSVAARHQEEVSPKMRACSRRPRSTSKRASGPACSATTGTRTRRGCCRMPAWSGGGTAAAADERTREVAEKIDIVDATLLAMIPMLQNPNP